jgi:hypothetical protein
MELTKEKKKIFKSIKHLTTKQSVFESEILNMNQTYYIKLILSCCAILGTMPVIARL